MDVKSEVIEIIDELFMEDVSDMMDEDLFDAGVLDSICLLYTSDAADE